MFDGSINCSYINPVTWCFHMVDSRENVETMEIEVRVPTRKSTRRKRNASNEVDVEDRNMASIPIANAGDSQPEATANYSCNNIDSHEYTFGYVLYVHQSRVLWLGLIPLLYISPTEKALRAIEYILCNHITTSNIRHDCKHKNSMCWIYSRQKSPIVTSLVTNYESSEMVRSFSWNSTLEKQRNKRIKIILSIVPPQTVYLEYSFMRHLLRYEHNCIRAQSISGYISTIGGGYFLCHHFRTAILLAQYQQYLAILLNDDMLYYTCFVQMAYSYIYNGQFAMAQSILRNVMEEMNQKIVRSTSTTLSTTRKYEIVQNMCQSAQLFGRRMRRYTKRASLGSSTVIPTKVILDQERQQGSRAVDRHTLEASRTGRSCGNTIGHPPTKPQGKLMVTKTIDNFQRIRIVPDQSRPNDFSIPFSSSSI